MRIANYQPRLVYPDIPQMDLATYEWGLKNFINLFLEGFAGEAAFYQFGRIRTPGVSDIDLLIVTKDADWKNALQHAIIISQSSDLLSYLFVHPPLVVGESILPALPFLHTLQHCKHLQSRGNTLSPLPDDVQDIDSRLFRHVSWNSFIRLAALEMDNKPISLRRAMILMHNLLEAAHNSNNFLSRPIPNSLSTNLIREEILNAPSAQGIFLIKAYIQKIMTFLNRVDENLNRELLVGIDVPPFVLVSRSRYIISIDVLPELQKNCWHSRLLSNALVVPVPDYLVVLMAVLAPHILDQFTEFARFTHLDLPQTCVQKYDTILFAKNLNVAARLFNQHDLKFSFPLPFSHRDTKISLRKKTTQALRKQLLLRQIARWSLRSA